MKVERQFESDNYIVRISVESKNVKAHSTLTNHVADTREEIGNMATVYGTVHEGLFRKQWNPLDKP